MEHVFETHAHYDDEWFEEDRDALLVQFPGQGIEKVVNIAASLASIPTTIALAEQYDYIYAAVGVHPSETKELTEENFSLVREMAQHPKAVAVGEIGLDYYWDETERSVQKYWFERQIELARELKKPLVIHSRDAAKDTMDMMKALHTEEIGGVIHCFSNSVEMAKEYVNMGFYIGVGGVVTFKNARVLKEVVQAIPLERIVLETDSPYLAPVPYRGKRNCSLYLPYVVTAISELKQVSEEEVVQVTNKNAHQLYRLEGEWLN
ncbi:MAG: TatD family hydrolase [Clostridiales bacterium]|nr:TatD family hydrolase [Clostridiales bacterium]